MNDETKKEGQQENLVILSTEAPKEEKKEDNTLVLNTNETKKEPEVKIETNEPVQEAKPQEEKTEEELLLEKYPEITEIKAKPFDKSDIKWYIWIAVFTILLLMPPITRIMFKEVTNEPLIVDVVKLTLSCNNARTSDTYRLSRTFKTNYEDGVIQNSVFTFRLTKQDSVPEDQIINFETEQIPEIINLESAVGMSEHIVLEKVSDTQYVFTVDYTKDPLTNITILNDHRAVSLVQKNNYEKQGMVCGTETETFKREIPRN